MTGKGEDKKVGALVVCSALLSDSRREVNMATPSKRRWKLSINKDGKSERQTVRWRT